VATILYTPTSVGLQVIAFGTTLSFVPEITRSKVTLNVVTIAH